MNALRRVTQQAEKPGRLHLAILEWQRQLIAQRASQPIGRLNELEDVDRIEQTF
jgi:hypothetical protein